MKRFKFFLLIPILIFGACDGDRATVTVDSEYQQDMKMKYFTEYSNNYVSVRDGFVFRFRSEYDRERSKDVAGVSINPNVAGELKWVNSNTLVFQPDNRLDYDKDYAINMDIANVLEDVDFGDDKVTFNIRTQPLHYNITLNGFKIKKIGVEEEITYLGTVSTSDYAESQDVESVLSYKQSASDLKSDWNHSQNGRIHDFVISGIRQIDDASSTMYVKWKGGKWDRNFSGTEEVIISAKAKFELADVKVSASPQRVIRLHFSRPISNSQKLDGLITINGKSSQLKTEVDGNVIILYPSGDLAEKFSLYVSDKIMSVDQKRLGVEHKHNLQFALIKPAIRKIGSGMIMPNTTESIYPIEAINLTDIDIEIVKIFENNVLQYLQDNDLGGNYSLNQVGRIVHREKINVAGQGRKPKHNQWTRIGLDLKKYVDSDPGAIYQIRVGFQKAYAITDCKDDKSTAEVRSGNQSMMEYSNYYYSGRNNSCKTAYYNPERFISQNVLSSDVGVVAKVGKGNLYHFALSSISSNDAIGGARIRLYDFQQQLLADLTSNGNGFASVETDSDASFAIISDNTGYAYIKYQDQNSNSLSDFDIGGESASSGVDGFVYLDRGVHRPGDTIFLNFILEDSKRPLPNSHPVKLEIRNPKGNLKHETTTSNHIEKIYAFQIPIDANALTGKWKANVKVGAKTFSKTLRIETIKSNRLKIEIDAPDEIKFYTNNYDVQLKSRWLHGAPASDLRAKIDAQLKNYRPDFRDFKNYSFLDPARRGNQNVVQLYDGNLDEDGYADIHLKMVKEDFPGKVKADIKTRVFEKGGNFSENYSSVKISPFESYVGVQVPTSRWGYKSVKIGEDATFRIATVADDGKAKGKRRISVGIYNIDWRWWYYQGDRYNIYKLNTAQHKEAFYNKTYTTDASGRLDLPINMEDVERGRKMIRICDLESGHCTGEFFYASGWGRVENIEEKESLAKLNFSADKTEYGVGEEVVINIPSEEGSKILMSIESGSEVLFQEWITGRKNETTYKFKTKAAMAPNVYAHATMIQSYDEKENDLPIRMYGVIPINVTDDNSVVTPAIVIKEKIEPKETFKVKISERDGKPMAYTIAIVDEGLLDLTNFNTPDPHSDFYAKQSLGVKTWDLYDYVMTGISGSVDRIISIGGDDEGGGPGGTKKAIRFKPVVMTAGPFYLSGGQSKEHQFTMPNYIGSVRAMVVARYDKAFGKTDKTVPVKKDIMILPTMPRVLGPGEKVRIPVSVFANEDNIKNVNVTIEATDNLEFISDQTQQVSFSKPGEKLVFFEARVREELGIAKVQIKANSGSIAVDQEIELDIRNPNPYESEVYDYVLEPGESWQSDLVLVGMNGTNEGQLELSAIPPLNLEGRLNYLTRYPYGCIEQTTSAAFPQLSLEALAEVDFGQKKKIEKNINGAIRRLSKMQLSNGGFGYWPGAKKANQWGTTYAGHFLLTAKDKGYYIPSNILKSWVDYQKRMAKSYRVDRKMNKWRIERSMINQAYRLLTLSLYGSPDLTAMNVLKQERLLPNLAQYMLSAAYAYSGKQKIALDLVKSTATTVKPYKELSVTYGSDLRDMAIIAQSLIKLDRIKEAGGIIKKIAKELSSNRWYSTQTISHSLLAVAAFVGEYERDNMSFNFEVSESGVQDVEYDKPVYLYAFDPDQSDDNNVSVTNNSKDVLFARVTMRGQKPAADALDEKPYNRNITMNVTYKDMAGKELDPTELERGTDFLAHVYIKNQNSRGKLLEEMALTQIFPSGWEIQSGGLSNVSDAVREDSYEYRDVRDDRVNTFFDLGAFKSFKIMLTAAYDGEYILPPTSCEAMYDNEIQAKSKGMKVRVIAPKQ